MFKPTTGGYFVYIQLLLLHELKSPLYLNIFDILLFILLEWDIKQIGILCTACCCYCCINRLYQMNWKNASFFATNKSVRKQTIILNQLDETAQILLPLDQHKYGKRSKWTREKKHTSHTHTRARSNTVYGTQNIVVKQELSCFEPKCLTLVNP